MFGTLAWDARRSWNLVNRILDPIKFSVGFQRLKRSKAHVRAANEQSLLAYSFCFALFKMNNAVTAEEDLSTQLEKLHLQPELKAFLSQMCNNFKAKVNQIAHLQNEMH